ncbi:MAG: hypothetical protein EPO20_16090 [Betaproteobacteria bacterium]|nr:MAG: hypothetical protein EPO20_16090 [Betaproteobacteria bacterium]
MPALDVTIDDLLLDLKNPRFDGLASQREALEKIVFSQGRKLVNLADDIATEGLSPAHRMLIVRARGEKGKYVVIDGNRRLAALRVMVNPAALDGMDEVGDSTKKQLKTLAKTFERTSVEPIEAYLLDDQEARHWIEAIHTGENEGRGVVHWDGIMRARFRGESASLKALALVQAKGKLTETELASLERFPITNLDRLLATPEVRDRLGIVLEEGNLLSDVNASELVRALKRIVTDLASKKIRVSDIDKKADRLRYMDELKAVLPDLSKRSGNLVPIDSLATGTPGAGAAAAGRQRRRSLAHRKALIPAEPRLYISDAKIEEIYIELRKLPLESYPNAIGALARVFIELSADHYGRANVAGYSIDWELKKKIDQVGNHLQANGVHRRDLQPFRRLASSADAALSVDRLHGIIHSQFALPTPSELRRGWDEIGHVFPRIWTAPPPKPKP